MIKNVSRISFTSFLCLKLHGTGKYYCLDKFPNVQKFLDTIRKERITTKIGNVIYLKKFYGYKKLAVVSTEPTAKSQYLTVLKKT